jgi:S1-C subfamily serine protease
MAPSGHWQISPSRQPKPEECGFDLDQALSSIVGVHASIPVDAFTAETLGTDRAGNGVVIGEGVVLTIGYLITEAEEVWILAEGERPVPAHPLAYDQVTGFGLVQALGPLDLPTMPLGDSGRATVGTHVVAGGAGGRSHSLSARIIAKQEFAGYWEYLLDEAIFTAPAHPLWGGAAFIGPAGELLGVGSLQVESRTSAGQSGSVNMVVPIDLIKPILPDMLKSGRAKRPARPWLGLFASELDDKVVVAGAFDGGPAESAGLQPGDLVLAVAGEDVSGLAGFYRAVWGLGAAGVEVPLSIFRDGRTLEARIASADRDSFLKKPRLHA